MNALSAGPADNGETRHEPAHVAFPASLRRIILTGFMGAGKSTVGHLLAMHLGWTFLDLDTFLEHRAGATVSELFERHGESHFRRLESSALASALRQQQIVLALGGGAPETLTNRLLLEQTPGTITIFLDAPFSTLYDRCVLQQVDRPNLRNPESAQSRFYLRRPLYLRLARITVDTSSSSPSETIPTIISAILQPSLR